MHRFIKKKIDCIGDEFLTNDSIRYHPPKLIFPKRYSKKQRKELRRLYNKAFYNIRLSKFIAKHILEEVNKPSIVREIFNENMPSL